MADQNRRPARPQGAPELVHPDFGRPRVRTARTIDDVEGMPLPPRGQSESRLDLFRAVRERPAVALGVMFGAGILLGYLTGAGEAKEPILAYRGAAGAELWERRARRLRSLSRDQEAELTRLRLPLDDPEDDDFELDEEEELDFDDEEEEDDDDFDLDDDEDDLDDDDPLEDDDLDLEYAPRVENFRPGRPSLPAFIREGMQRMIRRDARSA